MVVSYHYKIKDKYKPSQRNCNYCYDLTGHCPSFMYIRSTRRFESISQLTSSSAKIRT